MVPVVLVLKNAGLGKSVELGIIVPPAATPTGAFMMRQI